MKTLCSCLLLFATLQSSAQTVTTIARDAVIGDGLYVDSDRVIYTGSGGLVGKTSVGVVTPDGGADIFAGNTVVIDYPNRHFQIFSRPCPMVRCGSTPGRGNEAGGMRPG